MKREELTSEQIAEEIEAFAKNAPPVYLNAVKEGSILERSKQIELSLMDKEALHSFIMEWSTSNYMRIFPEHASPALKELDNEISKRLNSLERITLKDLPRLRKELGDKAKILDLEKFGNDIYVQQPRKRGAAMQTGKPEFKVASAAPIEGPHFFATNVGGYYGFLKYYLEEVGRIAPQNANSYLLGSGWVVEVEKGRAPSPLIAGSYFDVNQKDDVYQVVPIKFFNAEIDRSQKYRLKTKVGKRNKGTATSIIFSVVPRK
jgi:hypothetical protein